MIKFKFENFKVFTFLFIIVVFEAIAMLVAYFFKL